MTIASGVSSLKDPLNVLGYAFLDSRHLIPVQLTILRSTVIVQPGDTIAIQAVTDVSSTDQRVDCLGAFHIST